VPAGGEATVDAVDEALTRVLRSEHNHFTQLWEEAPHPQRLVLLALAEEPTRHVYAAEYHDRHELPANPTLQISLGSLIKKDVLGRNADGEYSIVEPFLAEWLTREQSN
jgi:hypothetical protein